MGIYGSLMDIYDKKQTILHAPAQPRKGFIYGNSKNKNSWELVAH